MGDYIGDDELGFSLPAGLRGRMMRRGGGRALLKPMTMGRGIQSTAQRRQPFGLGLVALAIGPSTGSLTAVVQKPFQPERLILDSGLAAGAGQVTDIKIGARSQLSGVAALPVAMFAPTSVGTGIVFDPAGTGVTIQVDISNSGAVGSVLGSMLGVTAE